MNKNIMFVEDNDVVRENYIDLLSDEGFVVAGYPDRGSALIKATEELPDLVLLDISLSDERDAGFQLCAELRRLSKKLPIIFFTSHDDESDKISGIRLGADDYVTKDVSIKYLVIRMEALLRRCAELVSSGNTEGDRSNKPCIVGPLSVDLEKLSVYWRSKKVDLSLSQVHMIHALVEKQGRVVSFARLMRAADICVEPNTVTAHVRSIRNSFKSLDPEFAHIESVRGMGYRWLEG